MGVGESEAIGAISPSDSGRETARGTAHCAHICLRHCIRLARHAAPLQVYVLLSTVMAWTQTLQDFDATCRVVELDCVLTTGQWQDQRREGHHTPNARGRWMWDGAEPLIYAENPTRPPLPGLYPVFYSGPTSPLKTVCNCPIVQASLAFGETKRGLFSFEILGTLKTLNQGQLRCSCRVLMLPIQLNWDCVGFQRRAWHKISGDNAMKRQNKIWIFCHFLLCNVHVGWRLGLLDIWMLSGRN